MNEKLIKMLSMFPVLSCYSEEQWLRMGYSAEAVAAAKAEIKERAAKMEFQPEPGSGITANASFGALNWNVVIQKAIKGFATQKLAPLVDVFSTNISGACVPADNPKAMPTVTVPVVNMGDDTAAIDPTNLDDLNSGSAIGVPVQLHLIGDGIEIPISAITEGYTAEDLVAGCVESVRRKVMAYVLGQLTADQTDADGNNVAAVGTTTVPALGEGWSAGYVNTELSEALDADAVSLLVNRPYYGGLKRTDGDSLSLNEIDVEGVHKVAQVSVLDDNAVGLLAAKNSMAVAMRAPVLYGPAYPVVMQFVDGDTRLPLTMVQYYKPGEMTMHVKVLTAIGAARVVPTAATILVTGTADEPATDEPAADEPAADEPAAEPSTEE